jgi:hypothetical protein
LVNLRPLRKFPPDVHNEIHTAAGSRESNPHTGGVKHKQVPAESLAALMIGARRIAVIRPDRSVA